MDAPPAERSPCAAWSAHAAHLVEAWLDELQAWPETPATDRLVAEGQLVRLRHGVHCPPDLLRRAVPRALLLGAAIGDQLRADHVIGGASAVWVLLGGRPPESPVLHTPSHRTVIGGVRVRHVTLGPQDVETIGGAPITTPARTAVDLLRFRDEPGFLDLVAGLLESGHLSESALDGAMERFRGTPGSNAAARDVRALLHGDRGGDGGGRAGAGAQAVGIGSLASTGFPSAVTRYAS